MKKIYYTNRSLRLLTFIIIALAFLNPLVLFGQKVNGNGNSKYDLDIVLSCTEYIGDGTIVAHFGYENKGKKTIVIDEAGSVVTYNHGQAKKYGLYTFEPGVTEVAFSQEFDSKDRVEWTVEFPDGTSKTTDANINSNHCKGIIESLDIIPGYLPPEGGKEYLSKIGAELTSLNNAYAFDPDNFSGATDAIFQIAGTKVLIEVVSNSGQYGAMLFSLDSLGFDLVTSNPILNRATGWEEIGELLELNFLAALELARPVYPGVSNYSVPLTGRTKSQGDFAMHSDFARLGYEIDGSGVKIGVLSNSYNSQGTADDDVRNGDLPGLDNIHENFTTVKVYKDILPTHGTLSDEGRAMLQIVHDIAPGAELVFRTGYLGELDMAQGIRQLADSGVHVIVDDLSYITEPFFRDGVISQTIDSVVSEGHTFFSSAGNFGRASYEADFNSTAAPSTITGTAHDFSGDGDIFQSVMLPEGNYTLVLQWDDDSDISMNTTTTDLDLFLSDDVGFSLLGFNRENVGGFPIEVVPFSVIGDSVQANIVIARASGTVPVHFKYMLFRGGSQFRMLEYGGDGSSTIVGHPNAEGAISVGAVRFDKNPTYNKDEYPVPVIMSFSSVGGTPVNGVVRDKPDITAPNGVNTTVDLGNGDWDSPIDPDILFPNFFGTSAASPHAAGVAALIMDAKLKYDSISHVSPDTIRALLKSTAIDGDAPGEDHVSGSGFIQAHEAIMTFANPSPYLENLLLAAEGGVPGVEITPFSFIIKGDFFTDSTQVLFRGEPLDTGVVVVDESTIIVNHEGFIGNPEVQVFNPVISESGLDGGGSNEKQFSDSVRQRVFITANNLTKKFGEVLHDTMYSSEIQVVTVDDESLSLEEAVSGGIMLQLEADRLEGLSYGVPAGDTSDAGQYIIIPSLYPEVDTVNPAEIDLSLSERFIVEFVSGNLIIEKLPLTITPMDTSFVYGEMLPDNGFSFSYQIGDSSLVFTDLDSILQSVQQEHSAALTNEIALVRGVALVNGIPLIRGTALVNGVTMRRGIALVNGVEVKVEVLDSDTTVYVAGEPLVNGGSLIRGVALVNDRPFVSMTQIVRGIALVNGDEVTFDDGFMTALNGVPLENKIAAVRGVALVNGIGQRGIALVNGHTVEVEDGITSIDGEVVPNAGIALVNGIPVIRGTALVNSSLISRGVALVNGMGVVIENGIPTGRGIALVNGSLRGIALVNGLPLIRGTALVNNLEVNVVDGEVSTVFENGTQVLNGLTMNRGIALVNGTALVNGSRLISRGTALVNGIALTDDEGDGEDLVNLANMNMLASGSSITNGIALVNGLRTLRGTALVNGIEGVDGESLKVAAGSVQENGSIVYESSVPSRGLALVNGLNYVRGTALVNGSPLNLRGTALVNGSTINDSTNNGTILVFDATELGDTAENVGFTPISFITGTTVGQHWIVPGTYISNNYEISYGLGTLTIDPAPLTITAQDKSKTFGDEDPVLTFTDLGLLGEDNLSGALIREPGEDVDDYAILQGSLTAGENYTVHYDSAMLSILPASMIVSITAENKVYDGTRTATVALSDNRLSGSELDITFGTALFDDKHVGENKEVTVLGLSLAGSDAGNYVANTDATTTANITTDSINVTAVTDSKVYDGGASSDETPVVDPLADGDVVSVVPVQVFDDKHFGTEKILFASDLVISDGNEGNNYTVSYVNDSTGNIDQLEIDVTAVTDSKTYDGTTSSDGVPVLDPLMIDDVVSVVPTQVFDNKNYGTEKTLSPSGLVINDGNAGNNYSVSYVDVATGNIDQLEIDVTAVTDSKVYDGSTSSIGVPLVDALMDGDLVSSIPVQVFDTKHAESEKTLTASGLGINDGNDGENYSVNYVDVTTGNIDQLEIDVTAATDNKTYDGTTSSLGVPLLDILMDGDLVSSVPIQVFDTKHAVSGKSLLASGLLINDGNNGQNYSVTYVPDNTGYISALAINVTAVTDDKIYDGSTSSIGVPLVATLMDGDVVSDVPVQVFDTKNIGAGKALRASGLLINDGNFGENYNLTYVDDNTGHISALAINVRAITDTKVYDGTTSSIGVPLVAPLMSGDLVSSVPVQVFDTKHAVSGKTLTASGLFINDGNEGNNYAITYLDDNSGQITPLSISVTAAPDNKAYDGNSSSIGVPLVDPLMLGDVVTSVPVQVFDTKHAESGKSLLASGLAINDGNSGQNYNIAYVPDNTGYISALVINVRAVSDSKVYDGSTRSLGVPLVDPLMGGDAISDVPVQAFDTKNIGSGKSLVASGLVINDGNYGENYNLTYVDDPTGQITALAINVTAVTDTKEYDGFTTSLVRPVVDPLMNGDYVSSDPVQVFDNKNAATDKSLIPSGLLINDGNGGYNYNVTYVNDINGEITPKPLTVTPNDPFLYISEGDPLPLFAFSYMGWILGDVGNEGYTVLRDPDGAAYDQSSSSSADTYIVAPVPSNSNYTFALETGILHVNPYGPGTRAVKPVLNCIEETERGSGIYIANFEYRNDNDVAVYIPEGEDNILTGSGIVWADGQELPTMFEPGGETFYVYFDGSGLSYIINSRDGEQKVSNAANANSSSTKCKGNNKKTATVSGVATEEEPPASDELMAYPNPVVDKLHLSLKNIENYKLIQLYDFTGKSHQIRSIDKQINLLEIDLAHLSSGSYFIRVIMDDDSSRVVQLIKK